MSRRAKIVCTLGPATHTYEAICALVSAGMDVARIGLAHGSLDEAIEKFRRVRRVEQSLKRPIGTMIDLPGPKVRAGHMPDGGLVVEEGQVIRLAPGYDASTTELLHADPEGLVLYPIQN